jgi:hypothetical protein
MGIYEAMITTQQGLWWLFRSRFSIIIFFEQAQISVGELNDYGMRLIEILEQPHKAARV